MLLIVWLLFAAAVLILRYQVLPDIARYRAQIEQVTGDAIGLPVRIGDISAGWDGLQPELFLDRVAVLDRAGREALSFRRVEAVLSWRSLAFFDLRLHRLVAEGPTVLAERLGDGRIFVAGFQVHPSAASSPALADWFLHQEEIFVSGARLIWRDAVRQPPTDVGEPAALVLDQVNFHLENRRRHHRFSLRASPPAALAGPVELRGDLNGRSLSRLDAWHGKVYLAAPQIDLAAWLPWVESPVGLRQGRGGMRLWGSVKGGQVGEVSADLALADVRVTLAAGGAGREPLVQATTAPAPVEPLALTELPELDLASFQGRLGVRREGATYLLSGQEISLKLRDGMSIPPTAFELRWTPVGSGSEGTATVTQIDVGHFAQLAAYLPLDRNSRQTLLGYAPEGELKNLSVGWKGNAERLDRFNLSVEFSGLGMSPSGILPGFEGLSGTLVADQQKGRLDLASSPLALSFPAVFPQARIPLDELNARVDWTIKDGLLDVVLQDAGFSGPDAIGSARGRYRLALGEPAAAEFSLPGHLDLTAQVTDADATAVWRYLPHLIAEDVRGWVRDAVRGGRVREADLVLRGPLQAFPFPNNEGGQFRVSASVADGRLRYAPDWPEIAELATELRFEGVGASFSAQKASTAGVSLGTVKAGIADFSVASPRLVISGEAQGPIPGFTGFLDQSPLGEMLGRFYEDIRLAGDGKLNLGLDIPLDQPERAKVTGDFEMAAGNVLIDPLLPVVTGLTGRISFTESTAQANALAGRFFGRPLRVDLRAQDGEVRVAAFGEATAQELQRQYRSPLLSSVSGTLPWQAAVSVRDGRVGFAVQSSLQGLRSTLPAPFSKNAEATLPIRFSRAALDVGSGNAARGTSPAGAAPRDLLRLEVGEVAGAMLFRRFEKSGVVIERGLVAVGDDWANVQVPGQGLRVVVKQRDIDLDAWRAAWSGPATETGPTPSSGIAWPTPQFDLSARTVRLISRQWHDVSVLAVPTRDGVTGRIKARDMSGDWSWDNAGKGTLRARLKQLVLPDASVAQGDGAVGEPDLGVDAPDNLPAVDVIADELVLGKRRLGRLEILAENAAGQWRVPRFELSSEDGKISGKGVWTQAGPASPALTSVSLAVDAADLGKLLTRFGYPDAVRRGSGRLSGQLTWQGAPTGFDIPTLGGQLELTAERGQFNKLEPGIGKLLSLVSLQMLPRRIALDFRDVFSQGLAFENITGKVTVTRGALATDNLVIEGPAAKILMNGYADLANDRTEVRVIVQPELGTSVAIGAGLVAVNPAIGLFTLLAQKLLRDPINKIFAFEYEVTGALSDPQIAKVGGPKVPLTEATPAAPAATQSGGPARSAAQSLPTAPLTAPPTVPPLPEPTSAQ